MKEALKYWWLVLIKGIILVLLSFFIFRHPVSALVGLALYIGVSLMATGVLLIITALSNRKEDDQWGWKLAEGIMDAVFAFILLSNPAITATVFPFVVGFWMIFYGIIIFVGSFSNKKAGDKSWWMNSLGGILNVFVGYIVMNDIIAGAFAITFWIGSGVLIFGIVNISAAFRMKSLAN